MSQKKLNQIKQEVKEKALAKVRWQWFKSFKKVNNISEVCRQYGISRSQFYYWKKRIDVPKTHSLNRVSKLEKFISYSRKPKSSPKSYTPDILKLILKIRKRTNRGAEYIWFILRDKYTIYVSVSGIYKVLKRAKLVKSRRKRKKRSNTYEAPKYLPGEKIQIDTKYVQLKDHVAKKNNKEYRWVYQYTAIDLATGIKCKLIYENKDPQSSVDFLTRVKLFYPFPLQIIQTDNGFEYTWRLNPDVNQIHPFTLQCQLYGYKHNLIPPAYPRSNSHVERTHRTDEEEVYRGRTFHSLSELYKINLRSLKYFNEKRVQKSKHFLPPLKFGILNFQLHNQKLNYTVLNVCN